MMPNPMWAAQMYRPAIPFQVRPPMMGIPQRTMPMRNPMMGYPMMGYPMMARLAQPMPRMMPRIGYNPLMAGGFMPQMQAAMLPRPTFTMPLMPVMPPPQQFIPPMAFAMGNPAWQGGFPFGMPDMMMNMMNPMSFMPDQMFMPPPVMPQPGPQIPPQWLAEATSPNVSHSSVVYNYYIALQGGASKPNTPTPAPTMAPPKAPDAYLASLRLPSLSTDEDKATSGPTSSIDTSKVLAKKHDGLASITTPPSSTKEEELFFDEETEDLPSTTQVKSTTEPSETAQEATSAIPSRARKGLLGVSPLMFIGIGGGILLLLLLIGGGIWALYAHSAAKARPKALRRRLPRTA